MMTNIFSCFILNKIYRYIDPTRSILISFSGGLDSTVLLHVLMIIRDYIMPDLNIRAVYIDHGLNKNSKLWGEHCKKICYQWNIQCNVYKININFQKNNIESIARKARYNLLRKIYLPNEIIFTAHQLNDQIETFFLALKRGSGPLGLSSMSISSSFYNTYLIRPLLTCTRYQLLNYAKKNNLFWINDNSNYDERFDRNFLRLKIIPYMIQRWPQFLKVVFRTTKLCMEEESLLKELLHDVLLQVISSDGSLNIDMLMNFSITKRNFILRSWFKFNKKPMPSYLQLKIIWKDVVCAKYDAQPKLFIDDFVVRRFKNKLWITPDYRDLTNICLFWDLKKNNTIILPDNLGILKIVNSTGISIRKPNINENINIRFGLRGKIKIIGSLHNKKAKNIWQTYGIAPWLRNRIPLIYYNDILISAINIFITESGKSEDDQLSLKINWLS